MKKILLLISALFAFAPSVWAQHTYYVDWTAGDDSRTSTQAQSKTTPWKTAKGMANSSGSVSAYTCVGGDNFVLKSGTTWPFQIFPFSPCSGSASTSAIGCVGANCVTYTNDPTWFDATACSNAGYNDNAKCRPILSGGGWLVTNVSCNYDAGTSSGINFYVNANGKTFFILNNIELTAACSSTGRASFGNGAYIYSGTASHATYSGIYVHGAVFPATCASNPSGTSSPCGDFWTGILGLTTASAADTTEVHDFFCDGSDATSASKGQGWYSGKCVFGSPNTVYRSVFLNVPETWDPSNWVSFHDNTCINCSAQSIGFLTSGGGVHPHVINASSNTPIASEISVYNNYLDTVFSGQGVQGPGGGTPSSRHVFNNVCSNWTVSTTWNMSGVFTNNTCEAGADAGNPSNFAFLIGGGGTGIISNNHTITTQALPYSGVASSATTNRTESKASANGAGYTYAQTFQFSPVGGSSPTVGAGTNQTAYCNTFSDATATAACKLDTTYGVAYDAINHVVTGVGRTANARPSSGAWNIGAYEFTGATAPVLSFSPNPVAFGSVNVGSSSTISVTVTNVGTASQTNTSISVTGTDFTNANTGLAGQCTNTSVIPVSGSCVVLVKFTPSAVTSRSGTLTVNGTVNGSVSLSGTGQNGVSIPSVPTGLAATVSGSTVNLTWNTALGTPTSYPLSRSAVSGGPYTQISNGSATTYSDTGLANGTYFYVVAAQNSAGTSANSSQVSATVSTAPAVTLNPPSVFFGTFALGTTSPVQTIQLKNTGNASLTLAGSNSVTLSGANAADFTLTGATTCTDGLVIAVNGTCNITVTFTPSVAGAEVASVVVLSNDPLSPDSASLSGTGIGNVSITPPSISFGNIYTNKASSAKVVTYTNQSGSTVTFATVNFSGGDTTQFIIGSNTCSGTLVNGDSCTVSVTFNPTSNGNKSTTLRFTDSATGSPHDVPVSGNAKSHRILKVGSVV